MELSPLQFVWIRHREGGTAERRERGALMAQMKPLETVTYVRFPHSFMSTYSRNATSPAAITLPFCQEDFSGPY